VAELTTAIDDYIAHNNALPKPFIWTKSTHDIILKVNRGRVVYDQGPGFGFSRQYKTPGRVPEG
jgi:hypothetical protein